MTAANQALTQLIESDELYCARALRIRTKSGSLEPFIWNEAQRRLHAEIEEQRERTGKVRVIVLKGRQQGVSTYTAARFFKRAAMGMGQRVMILTHLDAATQNLFGMVRNYYDLLPDVLKPATKANSGTELSFSRLKSGYKVATAGSKNAGRSDTVQYLHGSEVAFWPNAVQIMAGLGQTVPNVEGSEVILESTANGMSNLFRRMWVLAVAGRSDYKAIFLPWHIQSEYRRDVPPGFAMDNDEQEYKEAYDLDLEQMAWRRAKIDTDFAGDVEWFDQEYPATPDHAFQRVGHKPLISTVKVSQARKQNIVTMERIGAHVVGLDVARFGDDDSSFFHRQGRVAWAGESVNGLDTMAVTGMAARMLEEDKTIRKLFIDVTGGLGAGVYDRLVELGFGRRVVAVNFGAAAGDPRKYFNKRSEMWGLMADWLHDPITPCIPDDDVLHSDLTAPTYQHTSNGQIKLDKKEAIKKELGRSPDKGDALALTFAAPVASEDRHTDDWRKRLLAKRSRKSAMSA